MRIQDNSGDLLRVEQIKGVRGTSSDVATKQAAQPAAPVTRTDRVQISDAGRALAAQGPAGAGEAGAPLDPQRAAAIRERVFQGAYNSLDAVDQVARRILASGDV